MMEYQVVVQMPGSSLQDYDRLIEIENALINQIGNVAQVDGHDMGSGEMNIFLITDKPQATCKYLLDTLNSIDELSAVRIAYRKIGRDRYEVLYPSDLKSFGVR